MDERLYVVVFLGMNPSTPALWGGLDSADLGVDSGVGVYFGVYVG